MGDNVELTYFDGRGLGEIIRLVLTAAGIQVLYCLQFAKLCFFITDYQVL